MIKYFLNEYHQCRALCTFQNLPYSWECSHMIFIVDSLYWTKVLQFIKCKQITLRTLWTKFLRKIMCILWHIYLNAFVNLRNIFQCFSHVPFRFMKTSGIAYIQTANTATNKKDSVFANRCCTQLKNLLNKCPALTEIKKHLPRSSTVMCFTSLLLLLTIF